MNECFKFATIKLDTSPAFSYFIANFQNLLVDDIMREAAYVDKKGVKHDVGTEHSCYTSLYLSATQNKYYWFDMRHLAAEVQDFNDYKKHPNIYYPHNSKSKISIFIHLISKELEKLTFVKTETLGR